MRRFQRCRSITLFSKSVMNWGLLVGFTLMLGLVASLHSTSAMAQSSPSLEELQKLRQSMQSNGSNSGSTQSNQSQDVILQPAFSMNQNNQRSRLERIMSAKAGTKLEQFGYDQFGEGRPVTIPQAGAVQDDYVLGPGDEIVVSLRGQENSEYRISVDRNGQVALPRINPILAAGRTLGDFRQDLQNAVARAYISTQAFVSVGRLRQIRVMVSGEVNNPGMRLVTGLSSASDAILVSGGVKKTGSLRNIKLVHNGKETTVDLYALLTQNGIAHSKLLNDGDRIIVPPLGKTVAVTGWVRRPGIYELPSGASGMSVRGLLALAGGLEIRGRYRLSVLRVSPDGSSKMVALSGRAGTVRDSDVLFAQPGAEQTDQQAVLSGSTPLAGLYSVGKRTTLADILKSPGAMGPSPYTLFGVISRRDPQTLLRGLVPFTPVAVLSGRENMDLTSNDIVRVLSVNESRLVSAVVSAFKDKQSQDNELARAPLSSEAAAALQQESASQGFSQQGKANTERQAIAELSVKILSPEGLLIADPRNPDTIKRERQAQEQSGASKNGGPTQQVFIGSAPQQDKLLAQNSANGTQYDNNPYNGRNSLPGLDQSNTGFKNGDNSGENRETSLNLQRQDTRPGGASTNLEARTFGQLARQLQTDPLVLVHFLMDHEVSIGGAVRGPGNFIVGPSTDLKSLVAAAGGTAGWADESGIEVISTTVSQVSGIAHTERKLLPLRQATLNNYILKPHDEIRFNQVYTAVGAGRVKILGQVRFPGTFPIERGERLSELLLRSGGLTDVAYPYGTVFLRKSVAETEREGFKRTADEMQNVIVAGLTRVGNEKTSPEAFTALQGFVDQLRNAKPLGRVSIIADPVLLAANPQRDPLLEAGDVIYIPQRPSTVAVLGQVMQPTSFPFSPHMSVADYIERAGGYAQFADKSLTFLVLPDGSARPVESSWLDLSSPDIPPGSTIVVPRDVAPIDLRQIIIDTTSILSQFAVTAASLAVLSKQ